MHAHTYARTHLCTLKQHMHTFRPHARVNNTCTPSDHMHTNTTHTHLHNTYTPMHHMHTYTTSAHLQTTCTLTHLCTTCTHLLTTCIPTLHCAHTMCPANSLACTLSFFGVLRQLHFNGQKDMHVCSDALPIHSIYPLSYI